VKLKFRGEEEETVSFVEKFKQLIEEFNWTDDYSKRQLVMCLNGPAAEWFRLWKANQC
jgi:hypothetical protein